MPTSRPRSIREGRLSIPAQLKLLKEYAAANGFAVVQYPAPLSSCQRIGLARVLSRNNWPQSYLASFGLFSSELDLECLLYLRGQALGITVRKRPPYVFRWIAGVCYVSGSPCTGTDSIGGSWCCQRQRGRTSDGDKNKDGRIVETAIEARQARTWAQYPYGVELQRRLRALLNARPPCRPLRRRIKSAACLSPLGPSGI